MPGIAGGKFVVGGGASQVGTHVAEQLLAGGAGEVVLVDNLSLGSADTFAPLLADPRCRFLRGDVTRLRDLLDPLDGADGVFTVAALMAKSIGADPWAGMEVNVAGVQNTLEACRLRKVGKIVFSSSVGVYGAQSEGVTDESAPLRWDGVPPAMVLYCATKVVGEGLLQLYHERHGLRFVALRYSAVYGERQHGRALVGRAIAEACERARAGLPILLQDASRAQDYVYAGDVARANILAMAADVSGEAVNVCSGVNTTQRRVAELVAAAAGGSVAIEAGGASDGPTLPAGARQAYSREKAKRLLGWEPEVGIAAGVARVYRWVSEPSRGA